MSLREFIHAVIVAFILATSIQNAHADYTPTKFYKLTYPSNGIYYTVHTQACADFLTHYQTITTGRNYSINNCSTSQVSIVSNPAKSDYAANSPITSWKDCGQGYVLWSTSPNGMCAGTEPPPPCEKGCNGACGTYYKLGSSLPLTSCIGSCTYKILDGIQGTSGSWIALVGDNQGTVCTPLTPAPTDASNTPEYNCASKGQSYGTVNGSVVCVAKGSIGSAPTAEVKEQPKTTTTPAPTPENPNPTPVESQAPPVVVVTTPPPAGSPAGTEPKVSSSTTNPDGSTTNKDESKESFCKDNPTSKLCKAETQCQENPDGPTCKHLCDKFPDSLACKDTQDFLEQAIGKPEDIPAEDTLEEKEIEAPLNFNRVSVPTANGCPPPLTMTLYGAPIVMSFQWLCDYASAFKPLMIAFALMFAATVVMGGVRSDAQPFQRGLF